MELTKSEMQIMDVLWASDIPLSRSDLLERSEQKSWKDSSVHILLNGLLQKRAIREAGFVKRSKTYGRTFAPTLTREEYFATTIFSHTYKPEIVRLFAALLKRDDISPDQLAQMDELLRQRSAKKEVSPCLGWPYKNLLILQQVFCFFGRQAGGLSFRKVVGVMH